jgi:hypothetical protein
MLRSKLSHERGVAVGILALRTARDSVMDMDHGENQPDLGSSLDERTQQRNRIRPAGDGNADAHARTEIGAVQHEAAGQRRRG